MEEFYLDAFEEVNSKIIENLCKRNHPVLSSNFTAIISKKTIPTIPHNLHIWADWLYVGMCLSAFQHSVRNGGVR